MYVDLIVTHPVAFLWQEVKFTGLNIPTSYKRPVEGNIPLGMEVFALIFYGVGGAGLATAMAAVAYEVRSKCRIKRGNATAED